MEMYFLGVMVVITILIALRSMFTDQKLMNPPQYRLLNPEESNSINIEKLEWYQTEAEGQDFSLLGDFQLILGELTGSRMKDKPIISWERVLMDKPGTTFAIVELSDLTGRVRLELVTYFEDGQQYISGNYRQLIRIDRLPPNVTTKLYPGCCFEDLFTIHQEEVQRLSLSAKPISYPGFHSAKHEFVEKRIREFKDHLDYNISEGVFVKSNRDGYYQLSIIGGLRSFFRGASVSKSPRRDKDKYKAYRTGFTHSKLSEKYRQKKGYILLALAYGLVIAAAAAYKSIFLLPDPYGSSILVGYSFMIPVLFWIGHAIFISLRLEKIIIFLYLIYYAVSILVVYVILWSQLNDSIILPFFAIPIIGLMRLGLFQELGIYYHRSLQSQKLMSVIFPVVLALISLYIAFSHHESLQFISRIHSLRNLESQNLASVRFYGFIPGEPFDINTAKAETSITRPDRLAVFAASLSDMSPYHSPGDRMEGEYIAAVTRADSSVILIPLGKGNTVNPDAVYINFFTTSYLREGTGTYSHGEYQSKKLYNFIESLHLEKWQNSEKTQD